MIDLYAPGAYARTAGGNLERPDDQKQAVDWIAWSINPDNGGNGGTAVWETCRNLWDAKGIQHFPWMHVRSMEHLLRLISVGEAKNSPAIGFNVENIVEDGISLQEMGGHLLDFWVNRYEKPVHMATLAWVQNGQGWQYVDFAVAALEIFPDEQVIYPGGKYNELITDQCIEHAFKEGLKKVTLMLKTKNAALSDYGKHAAYCGSLYTADDIEPSASGWKRWTKTTPCIRSKPPIPPEAPMLSVTRFPYTGPCYGPNTSPGPTLNRATVKGLKRAMIRLRYLDQPLGSETDDFGLELEEAMKTWYREEGGLGQFTGYGKTSWTMLRSARLTQGPNKGTYAMDSKALAYVKEDALTKCYPHPAGISGVFVGQGPHQTDGLPGVNIAIDFMAPGGTPVLAVENAQIVKLSGHDPKLGVIDPPGVFGWTIYYDTPAGYSYFSTHYGKVFVTVGQHVDCGQKIAEVGHWPGDPGRSHTHLGVTSSKGRADATKRILEITQAKKVTVRAFPTGMSLPFWG